MQKFSIELHQTKSQFTKSRLDNSAISNLLPHRIFYPHFLLQQTRIIPTHLHKKYTHNTQLKRKPH